MRDGPLDMRMDVTTGETASAWLARVSFEELRAALKTYGEGARLERLRRIVESRDRILLRLPISWLKLLRQCFQRTTKRHPPQRHSGYSSCH